MTNPDSDYEKVAQLLKDARIAIVTTVDTDGKLVSRPLALLDRPFDGQLMFFTPDPSPKTEQVQANSQVNVAIQVDKGYLSIAGTATVTKDPALIDELWNAAAEAWFENGKEDPTVAVLCIHADSAEYWTTDTPKPVAMLKYVKAMVTGGQPDVGENAVLKL